MLGKVRDLKEDISLLSDVGKKFGGHAWGNETSTLSTNVKKLTKTLTNDSFDTLTDDVRKINSLFNSSSYNEAVEWGGVLNDAIRGIGSYVGIVSSPLLKGVSGLKATFHGSRIAGAKLGAYFERRNQVYNAIDSLPVSNIQRGLIRNASNHGEMKPDNLARWAQTLGGLNDNQADDFKKRLEDIDRQVNKGFGEQIDEILNGSQSHPRQILNQHKSTPKEVRRSEKNAPRLQQTVIKKSKSLSSKRSATPGAQKFHERDTFTDFQMSNELSPWAALRLSQLGSMGELALPSFSLGHSSMRPLDDLLISQGSHPVRSVKPKPDSMPEVESLRALNEKRLGTEKDPLVQNMREYQNLKDEIKKKEAEDWKRATEQLATEAIGIASNLIADTISGRGVSGAGMVRSIGGLIAGGVGFINPIAGAAVGAGVNIISAGMDASDEKSRRTREVYEAGREGKFVNRSDFLEGARQGLGAGGSLHAETAIAYYEHRASSKLAASLMSGPEGDLERAKIQVEEWAESMKNMLDPQAINKHKAAMIESANAAFELGKSLENAKARAGLFAGNMSVDDLRDELGVKKRDSSTIGGSLMRSGVESTSSGKEFIDLWKKFAALDGNNNMMSGSELHRMSNSQEYSDFKNNKTLISTLRKNETMSAILDRYDGLLEKKNSSSKWQNNDSNYEESFLEKLGIKLTGDKMNSLDEALSVYKDVLIPALRSLKESGSNATQNIGSVNASDNELRFDAPETRMITYNQQLTVQTYAVTGDKASFRDFVHQVMTEARTMGEMTV